MPASCWRRSRDPAGCWLATRTALPLAFIGAAVQFLQLFVVFLKLIRSTMKVDEDAVPPTSSRKGTTRRGHPCAGRVAAVGGPGGTFMYLRKKKQCMPGKFEVYKDAKGEYRFRLKAANGEIILSGEGYSSRAGCMNGIESVRKNAGNEKQFDLYTDTAGKSRFRLNAANRQIIGTGQAYSSEATAKKGIASVQANAPDAKIVETEN